MPSRFTILAVCTANICRSPLMELLLRDRLEVAHFDVASAGVRGWDSEPMDSMAVMEAHRLGCVTSDFRSQPITPRLIDSADLILTATREHRSALLSLAPQALRKSFTLVEFAALVGSVDATDPKDLVAQAAQQRSTAPARIDVDDPYRRGPAVHRATADQIDAAVDVIAQRLNAVVGAPQA